FTDGSAFTDITTIPAPEDVNAIAHSAVVTATPATITGTAAAPGSTQLVLTDIRDMNGTHVPDGAKVALSAVDSATTDPRGGPMHSVGGTIVDGIPATNNTNFKIFTVSNGTVVANYTMPAITPAAILGSTAVVQVIAADSSGNILGHEAIATID